MKRVVAAIVAWQGFTLFLAALLSVLTPETMHPGNVFVGVYLIFTLSTVVVVGVMTLLCYAINGEWPWRI